MSGFARGNGCHVIAPIHTLENSACYNAAVLIDREGKRVGEYRKIRTTVEEMDDGVSPGPTDPPVFQTDLGVIGIQICFDIEWADGWRRLHEKGAEIVFWPSAFGGGKRVNTMAWTNKYCMVSSTALGTSRICDVTGETVLETGRWNSSGICAALNLEKALVHTWPYVERFAEIQVKYGRKVRIYNLHEEELTVIESRSADVKVADILREYQIKGWDEHLLDAEKRQERMRHSQGGD
jgi:predicted amidohydrolase